MVWPLFSKKSKKVLRTKAPGHCCSAMVAVEEVGEEEKHLCQGKTLDAISPDGGVTVFVWNLTGVLVRRLAVVEGVVGEGEISGSPARRV